jgi:hypothetical protein
LRRAAITIERFGDFHPIKTDDEISRLKPTMQKHLMRLGALKYLGRENGRLVLLPEWETHLKYHWKQDFPPGVVVRMRHEYKPVAGLTSVQVPEFMRELPDVCITPDALNEIERRVASKAARDPNSNHFGATWVSYILTTANTWKTPIRDFQLTIQGPDDGITTFCWDGPVEKSGSVFKVHKINFVPKKELRVYFFEGLDWKVTEPGNTNRGPFGPLWQSFPLSIELN